MYSNIAEISSMYPRATGDLASDYSLYTVVSVLRRNHWISLSLELFGAATTHATATDGLILLRATTRAALHCHRQLRSSRSTHNGPLVTVEFEDSSILRLYLFKVMVSRHFQQRHPAQALPPRQQVCLLQLPHLLLLSRH
jgi:hypothetical protein